MDPVKRLLFAALILAGGVGVAMLFRKPSGDHQAAQPSGSALTYVSDGQDASTAEDIAHRQGVPLPTPFDPTAKTPPPLEAPSMPAVKPPTYSRPRDELVRVPPSLPALDREDPLAQWQVDRSNRAPFSNTSVAPRAVTADPPSSAVNRPARFRPVAPEYRTHTIVNGDTLKRIAKRYLGDASRYVDIFELNRGVLSDPEVLPIGEEIKLPARKKNRAKAVDVLYRPPQPVGSSAIPKLVPLPPDAFGPSRP
jgi:LysM repeat protein